eukprot:CAMPEP_0201516248 /NCGR_PEP_ID=MMETSP0161_2-20130828/7621_1 /ASSEMBLY_ACC=CAM_ASM_000251 /TAXON_ID=180227 /ORGANISM="Neoparamoeba aestuarina, Strain SoJaBio B1-5/56/2" /LENGTH=264 /DNA_ID=CAMNT_0047913311 /DNA_START=62 /DNA_END=857 /DNA_ORIENTATION=-
MTASPSFVEATIVELKNFYNNNTQIKESHGISHAMAVYHHAFEACRCCSPPLEEDVRMEILVAALLHDIDDKKYFPDHEDSNKPDLFYSNSKKIMEKVGVPKPSQTAILEMIGWVGCSKHGNSVPLKVQETEHYYLLIPRWSDRLEAVGPIGVIRCYQYNSEHNQPLSSSSSPRAVTEKEVWELATSDRFERYQQRGGKSDDMISHYYDKLLHVASPPPEIVRNKYLEEKGRESAKDLVEMCVRFGRTGKVDEDYVKELAGNII